MSSALSACCWPCPWRPPPACWCAMPSPDTSARGSTRAQPVSGVPVEKANRPLPGQAQGLMTAMAVQQLTLDLAHSPALGREDFLVSPSNAAAFALVDQWPNWPTHGAVIVGPPGSGKSHLASVWQPADRALRNVGAHARCASKTCRRHGLRRSRLRMQTARAGRAGLFHALNLARQQGQALSCCSRRPDVAGPKWPCVCQTSCRD